MVGASRQLGFRTAAQKAIRVVHVAGHIGSTNTRSKLRELEFIDLLGGIAGSVIDDTMWRQARESLLKFEYDLQAARRIQQSTFPDRLPLLDGFDIAAWSAPAAWTPTARS